MPYTIIHSNGENPITVNDQSLNQETDLSFVGKNYNGYAKPIAENFLYLLENFANTEAPAKPIIGQLWYDTTNSGSRKPQLKLWDGSVWVPASNVFKSASEPSTALVGDIWFDTANQQLKAWNGTTFILIGPQYAAGSQTGPIAEKIYDTTNRPHNIIKFQVGIIESESPLVTRTEVAAIISFTSFTPKSVISGFSTLNPGLNLPSITSSSPVAKKVWGAADSADNLNVGTSKVSASNFLRKDVSSTTNEQFNIANKAGLAIGSSLQAGLKLDDTGPVVLYTTTDDSAIVIRLQDGPTISDTRDVITATNSSITLDTGAAGTIAVKNGAIEKLTISSDGNVLIKSDRESTSMSFASIVTDGGASIAKQLRVGSNMFVGGTMVAANIMPVSTSTPQYNLGTTSSRWDNVYAKYVRADRIYGTLEGTFDGNVNGSAIRLANYTTYTLTGEIESVTGVSSNGDGTVVNIETTINADIINNRNSAVDSQLIDELLINRPASGLYKITKDTFIKKMPLVPVGGIISFAGSTLPEGFLLCDGSEVVQSDYSKLHAVIGNTYGTAAPGYFKLPTIPPNGNIVSIIYTGAVY